MAFKDIIITLWHFTGFKHALNYWNRRGKKIKNSFHACSPGMGNIPKAASLSTLIKANAGISCRSALKLGCDERSGLLSLPGDIDTVVFKDDLPPSLRNRRK
jgi:hypothetical protein